MFLTMRYALIHTSDFQIVFKMMNNARQRKIRLGIGFAYRIEILIDDLSLAFGLLDLLLSCLGPQLGHV